ncbi:hypothetical protein HN51_013559, partial [Arachis hypogaea]
PTASVTLLIASWLTPSSLFIFVNLVIGTIAITSRFTSSHNNRIQEHELQHPFTRSPSLLQRVRSFRLTHQYTYDTGPGPNQPTSGGHLLLPRSYWPSHRDPPLRDITSSSRLASVFFPSCPNPSLASASNHHHRSWRLYPQPTQSHHISLFLLLPPLHLSSVRTLAPPRTTEPSWTTQRASTPSLFRCLTSTISPSPHLTSAEPRT